MLGEKLLMSLRVTLLGMGTVFIALIVLIYIIELINKVLNLNYTSDKKQDDSEDVNLEKANEDFAKIEDETISQEDEEELVAVITAAIAASLNRSTHDIVVRSVKRVPNNTPAWNRAGRSQQISGRFY